jgi:hypothetical protein
MLLYPGRVGVESEMGRPEACQLWDDVANVTGLTT